MNIWILTSETPFYISGGIARYVDNFARALACRGHAVTVFGRDTESRSQTLAPGFRYRSVVPRWERLQEETNSQYPDEHPAYPYNTLDYWGAFSYQLAQEVIACIRSEGPPDVIEAQEYAAIACYLQQFKLLGEPLLQDIPIVVHAHSPDFVNRMVNEEPRYQFPHYWTGRMEHFSLLAADGLVCPSLYLTRQLEEHFGGVLKPTTIPYPWTELPEILSGEVDPRCALAFGRKEVRKGTIPLIEACARLWEAGADFRLKWIGGDTPFYPRGCSVGEWIRKRFSRWLDSGHLQLQEALPHAALMSEVGRAGFVIIPSIWDNWPNTCMEAMALGKVVIASRSGGQAEMIGEDGAAGLLFSWDEPDTFAEALQTATGLSQNQRAAMGAVARQRIRSISDPASVVCARLAHFAEVIRNSRPRTVYPFINRRLRQSRAKEAWLAAPEEVRDRVSVVIPFYNLAKYLPETVASVDAADWPDKEIVIIDDGSDQPDSLELLQAMAAAAKSGLRIIRQRNRGLASARNAGVEAATGEFVLLLDADDQIEPSFIRKAVDVLRRYDNVHVVYAWERYIESCHDIYPVWNFDLPYLLGHNMTCPVSLLYRQSFRRFGPSKVKFNYNFEDYELWINLVKHGCGGVAIPEPLCRYRIRQNSLWQGSNRNQHLFLYDLLAREHPELYREYGVELFQLQNANGPAQTWNKPCSESPYDAYLDWSQRRINNLDKQASHWWQTSQALDKRLKDSEASRHELWCEKLELQRQLSGLRESGK